MRADKRKAIAQEIFSSYQKLARQRFPEADLIALNGAHGETDLAPQAMRLSPHASTLVIPAAMDGKVVAALRVPLHDGGPMPENRTVNDIVARATPLLDCLCRELSDSSRQSLKSATLGERSQELRWLFGLTERLRMNSTDPRTVGQLMGAVVERLKCCFGAVVVPEHSVDITYSSLVHIDLQAAPAFERCREYYRHCVQRRKQPLVANRLTEGSARLPFKYLLAPLLSGEEEILGYLVLMRQESSPNFGRRQLFLTLNLARQIASQLESQYDLVTGLLTRSAFCHDVQQAVGAGSDNTPHSLLYLNIDQLHLINEHLGFQSGDEAILLVADLLQDPRLPLGAVACRLNVDKFVIFLATQDTDQAWMHSQRLLSAVSQRAVGPESDRMALSVSCGIAGLNGSDGNLQACMAMAESASKSAKAHGGNRSEIYLQFDHTKLNRRAVLEAGELHAHPDATLTTQPVDR